ncbi:alanine/glycine:cation symporter family protein [Leifsonia poae]|uniref:alanine/glycine:cation symporter family protein n=1 Tax=Leifsonia poae TaxID=110933 RepID=UPI001CBFCF81|nr:alanine/glycine:cation symporter family protein [Leifsonia poae]
MGAIEGFVTSASDSLWSWIVLPVVVLLGLYFTVRTGVVQFRMFPAMLKTLTDKTPLRADGTRQSISAFQAFTVSAASRVGVGNIAGVGTALAIGGPGAIFWMWLMAFIGGASSFVESTLGQAYKVRDADGFRGGPAYYIRQGLKAPWAGVLFAVLLIVCFPFAFSSLQANTISATLASSIGSGAAPWLGWVVGAILALLTALVVFGGMRRIASVTQAVVPLMAVLYVLLGLVIVALHITELPRVIGEIFSGAVGFQSVAGGAIGTIILTGVKRGMFSNEAGLGSAPNAGSSAAVTHPVKQGLVQTLGVYFDTFLICTITAVIILVSQPDLVGAEKGIGLTFGAVTGTLGAWSGWLLTVIIFLLAFSSILGNYYYGEANVEFISTRPAVRIGYRILAVAAVFGGAVLSAGIVWDTADGVMGLMALTNLVAIALLSGVAFALLKDYRAQLREGRDPVFTRSRLPQTVDVECWEDELSVTGPIPTPTAERRSADKGAPSTERTGP